MSKYNQLRPVAFRLNRDAVSDKPEFAAYPFWTLGLPESLKQELLKIIANAANRSIDNVHLPVRVLNSAVRMLIPNLIAIEHYAGRINTQPWLYGFVSPDSGYPASSEAVSFLIRSWIRTALPPNIPPATLRTVTQQITADMLQWKRETMDLTHWTCAGNGYSPDDGTAIPYEKGTSHNGFVLWPDLIAARLSHTRLHWGRHNLAFRRVPTGQGQHGVELASWPPLEERVDEQIWPYSVLLTLTLQTIPFQNFPVLHCDIGIRRWAGPKVYLPKKVETSVYLLDQVPWIQGLPHNQCFQVAPIKWGYVPANQGTGESGRSRLGWGSDLIPLLDDLHLGKHVFPDPQEITHACGPMTIFLQIPEDFEQKLRVMLLAVGYWGQTSSLATCTSVSRTSPVPGECATTLSQLNVAVALRPYFSCLATEFRSDQLSWYDIVPDESTQKSEALRLDIYVWPMITDYRHGTNKLLVRTPLIEYVQ